MAIAGCLEEARAAAARTFIHFDRGRRRRHEGSSRIPPSGKPHQETSRHLNIGQLFSNCSASWETGLGTVAVPVKYAIEADRIRSRHAVGAISPWFSRAASVNL